VVIRSSASDFVMAADALSHVTVAKAVVPSRLICDSPCWLYGLMMLSMPGTLATRPRAAVTASRTAAERMVAPLVVWMTTWSFSPDAARKSVLRRLAAACESVPDRLRLEL
jgi:hypothetical protein